MTPLANVIIAGLTSGQRSTPNHVPSRPKPQITRVDDEQDPVLGAEVGGALDVALGREVDAAGADHGLAEERRDLVRADAPDLLLQRRQRVERHGRDLRDERAPVGHVGLDAAERGAEAVRAVVALGAQIRCTRSGWPWLTKWRRASLAATSIESPPPLVRKTLALSIGARAASGSQSSFAGRFATSANVW